MDLEEHICDIIQKEYDFGQVKSLSKEMIGDTNKNFIAVCEKDDNECEWFIKQYENAKTQNEIIYEHAFMHYFNKRADGRIQSPIVIPNKHGETWVYNKWNGNMNYYAVFDMMKGLQTYSWINNQLSETAFISCSESTAKFHSWAYGFISPDGIIPNTPNIQDQLDIWYKEIQFFLQNIKGKSFCRLFYDYWDRNLDDLKKQVMFCKKEFGRYNQKLPKCIIHGDLNPSNMMFDEKDHVTHIFDFEWVHENIRIYDIAWVAHQTLSSWDESHLGQMSLEKLCSFLSIYNKTIVNLNGTLSPLTLEESEIFPISIIAVCIKIVRDFISYIYYEPDKNVVKWYFASIKYIYIMHFCNSNYCEIQKSARDSIISW